MTAEPNRHHLARLETEAHEGRDASSGGGRRRAAIIRLGWGRTLEFRRYLTVGAANTALDYVLFIALTKALRIPLDWVWTAKVASGTVAISISFYLNRRWVFRAGGGSIGQAVRFVTTTAVGVYGIQTSLTHVFASYYPQVGKALYDALALTGPTDAFKSVLTEALVIKTVAFAIATVPTVAFNFLMYRLWVFPNKRASAWMPPSPESGTANR
jgi:putative flippase GtrA